MAWRNTLDLEILGSVACKLQNFSGQVFENSSQIDAGFGTDARLLSREVSQMTLYATAGELEKRIEVSASSSSGGWQRTGGVSWAMTRIGQLLTWRPALAECDFGVLTCESPFPPVLPPVFPTQLG